MPSTIVHVEIGTRIQKKDGASYRGVGGGQCAQEGPKTKSAGKEETTRRKGRD